MSQVNTIGKDYNLKDLIKFSLGPVISRFFISLLHSLDDGLFISRYCGTYALAAFSIAMPLFMLIDGFGMLFIGVGTKSSILMGEKRNEEAKDAFTTTCLMATVSGLIITGILYLFSEKILVVLGATEILMPYALDYMGVGKYYVAAIILNYVFVRFYTIAGKPKVNVFVTTVNTILNFLFDYVFIVRMQLGIVGTAYANLIANIFSIVFGVIFFSNKKQEIHFTKLVEKPFELLIEVFKLGRSSCVTSIALSLNSYIANLVLLKCASENGVAAYTIVNNVQFMFMNGFFGLLSSICPLISYAYGEKNKEKLIKLLKNALILTTGLALVTIVIYLLSQNILIKLYLPDGSDEDLLVLAKFGMFISPFALFVFSYNCLVQEIATSLSNYKISSVLTTLENVVFSNIYTIALPMLLGTNAVWFAFLATEITTFFFTAYVAYSHKDVYGYGKDGVASFIND